MMSMSKKIFLLFIFYLLICTTGCFYSTVTKNVDINKNCFCELSGSINDCSCNIDTVDHFNNMKIYPRLQSLLVKDYFRFYKVNLKQKCPFWVDNAKCAMKFCSVQSCQEEDIPEGLKGNHYENDERPAYKYTHQANKNDCEDLRSELSFLNTSISQEAHEGFQKWADHDEAEDDFCILDDQHNGAEYVDLLLNPERYTGYKGESAHRIWKSIYLENCFGNHSKTKTYTPYLDLQNACLEQRAFYRLISGLHTSINIHLCSKYLLAESKDFLTNPNGVWGPNFFEFDERFNPDKTKGQGPHWLKNLYFIYIVELRALAKASAYLKNEEYFTGIAEEDHEVKLAINDLLNVVEKFSSHFNETKMFSSGFESIKLKNDFKEKFRNISRIMDCVGCDKCRLWGKLQTQGLGTALKILFSEKFTLAAASGSWDNKNQIQEYQLQHPNFRLTRTEIVSLFNAFGRLSNSIYELENFRKLSR